MMYQASSFCGQQSLPVTRIFRSSSFTATPGKISKIVVPQAKQSKSDTSTEQPVNAGLKALWVVTEQLGKAVGGGSSGRDTSAEQGAARPALTREEVFAKIKDDYAQNYFIGGASDMTAYDPYCLYTDPFAGFRGTERFKQNLSNFGAVTEDVTLDWETVRETDTEIETKWRFSAILKLPWRPRLAASGRTTHVLSPDNYIIEHRERWDADPGQVVRLLLRPASPQPHNKWEEAMLALSKGDIGKFWLSVSDVALKVAAPLSILYVVGLLQPSLRLQGFGLGTLEMLTAGIFAASVITELYKISKA